MTLCADKMAKLAAKIDSLAKWASVARAALGIDEFYYQPDQGAVPPDIAELLPTGTRISANIGRGSHVGSVRGLTVKDRWWMDREAFRMLHGVYPSHTSVLEDCISNLGMSQYMPHISSEDNKMVAYTASVADGLQDRQVRTSFGKMLRKLCLLLTDKHIQHLEQEHASEMDPHVPLATTAAEMERVYTTMQGDTACMRYSSTHWAHAVAGWPAGVHPSHCYEAPGMAVAYLQTTDGTVTARCVVWNNPADPTDKRYVRVYGAPQLKAKLERAGYVQKHLEGARIKAIKLLDTANRYAVPYLDGPGGDQGSTLGHRGYIDTAAPGFIVITSRSSLSGQSIPSFKSTTPSYVVPTIDRSAARGVCFITGVAYDSDSDNTVQFAVRQPRGNEGERENGTIVLKTALDTALKDDRKLAIGTGMPGFISSGYGNTVFVRPEDFDDLTVLIHNSAYLNDQRVIEAGGWVMLTTHNGWYAPDGWTSSYSTVATEHGLIRKADSVRVYEVDTEGDRETKTHYIHIEEALALSKARTHVKIPPDDSVVCWAAKNIPSLVKTVSGRWVLPDFSPVVELFDGTWDFKRNTVPSHVYGIRFHIASGERLTDEQRSAFLVKSLRKTFGQRMSAEAGLNREQAESLLTTVMNRDGSGNAPPTLVDTVAGTVVKVSSYYNPRATTWAEMLAISRAVDSTSDETFRVNNVYEHAVVYFREWSVHVKALDAMCNELLPVEAVADEPFDIFLAPETPSTPTGWGAAPVADAATAASISATESLRELMAVARREIAEHV